MYEKHTGASPLRDKPYNVLLATYKSELLEEKVNSKIDPLTICGSTGMEAFLIAITKGEAFAVVFEVKFS